MAGNKKECEARVCTDGWHYYQCNRPAKVEVDGKHYCGIHNPIRLKEMADKRESEYHKGDCHQCKAHLKPYFKYCPWCGAKR